MRWYELAAAQGDPDALNNMATCYFSGHGVPQDAREALRLYARAAAKGHARAAAAADALRAMLG